jgi:uncharacterized protein YjbI with pentapeptide repeats
MPEPTGPVEPTLIQDPEALRRARASTGGPLRELILSLDLSHLELSGTTVSSVQALHVSWVEARISDVRFTDVVFLQCDFARAEFSNTDFVNCRFERCSFEDARLLQCRLSNVAFEGLNGRYAKFESCIFESFEDRSGVFTSATVQRCQFERCLFDNSAFYGALIGEVVLRTTTLCYVIFSGLRGSGLSFEDAVLLQCGFEDSRYGTLEIVGGVSKGLTFRAFGLQRLAIRRSERIEGLTALGCNWSSATITDCAAVAELTIERSRLQDLTLLGCQVAYLQVTDSDVSGHSRLADCRFAGLSLEDSVLHGTELANCTLSDYLALDRARFEAVVLKAMVYSPGLQVSAQGVAYLNGADRFPAG